jgi:hypothetical protein
MLVPHVRLYRAKPVEGTPSYRIRERGAGFATPPAQSGAGGGFYGFGPGQPGNI